MNIEYSELGHHLTLRANVGELSQSAQIALWDELNRRLGVEKWAQDNPSASEDFQLAWLRVMQTGHAD